MATERVPQSISDLRPGDAIELADVTQLPAFEDMVAEVVDPGMTESMRDAWAGRVAIRDALRPPKFNGNILDIKLVVMDEPYQRLFDANARGWTFARGYGKSIPANRTSDQDAIDSYHGFIFTADASSSRGGVVGQIQSELYYGLVPERKSRKRYTSSESGQERRYTYVDRPLTAHGGASVQRFVARPKIETEAFIRLHEEAVSIGLAILKDSLRPH
jgi:hypothetical protein